ncbi:VOC family protein [Georgenia sp. Z1491]|uniref:VOC family protein n=1 Tax=Georgenia sp. Z1491 TaxID=3416707 RepID=UPI003CE8E1E6
MEKLLAHLSHLEIASPDVAASAAFYVDKFGMRIIEEVDGKAYLRCWGDHQRYSLVISPGAEPALVTMAWRTTSAEALEEAGRRVAATGTDVAWADRGAHIGRNARFVGPGGHDMTLFWETERFWAEGELASQYPDRPERRSAHAGAPRFLDHVTVATADVRAFTAWYSETLGFRTMAFTDLDEAPVTVFAVLTTNEKSHDLGVVLDTSDRAGRVNHIAFWVDTREELLISADVLMERGTPIEYGPSIHGIGEQSFLYFREPSGLRVELNSGGYRNYVPDWEPHTWLPAEGSNNFYRNGSMPMSMTESFPDADGLTATEEGASPEMKAAILGAYSEHGKG